MYVTRSVLRFIEVVDLEESKPNVTQDKLMARERSRGISTGTSE